MTAKMK